MVFSTVQSETLHIFVVLSSDLERKMKRGGGYETMSVNIMYIGGKKEEYV